MAPAGHKSFGVGSECSDVSGGEPGIISRDLTARSTGLLRVLSCPSQTLCSAHLGPVKGGEHEALQCPAEGWWAAVPSRGPHAAAGSGRSVTWQLLPCEGDVSFSLSWSVYEEVALRAESSVSKTVLRTTHREMVPVPVGVPGPLPQLRPLLYCCFHSS